MLKSVECKQEMVALQAQIQDLTNKGEAAPQELLDQFEAKKNEYIAALEKEMEDKKVNQPVITDTKKLCNSVLKSLLTNKKTDKELVDKVGIKGIVDTVGTIGSVESVGDRGGYLVPEEYLELDKYGNELTMVPARRIQVTLPTGFIPNIDLSQAKDGKFLAKHDELDTIAKKNPVFGRLHYACETYTGIVPISMDLLDDTTDILPVVSECFSLTSKAQENTAILAEVNAIEGLKTQAIGDSKTMADKEAIIALRKAVLSLSGTNRVQAKIVVGEEDFAKLALIEDAKGHPYLCKDVTNPSVYRLEGIEIIAVDKIFMTGYALVGNFNRVAVVERKGLEISSDASNMFDTDALAVKGKKRFDVIVLEKGAFIKVA